LQTSREGGKNIVSDEITCLSHLTYPVSESNFINIGVL